MVTKGIIKSIDLLGNTCTVHIPFFETAGNDPIIETATVSNTPGSYNGYKVGDAVYVAFEDGNMSTPVIIGKLYLGTEKEKADPRGVINVEESTAAKKATLPADSKLTAEIDSNVPNTTVPYMSLSSIANELNTLNTNVGQMDRDYGNRFKQVFSDTKGLETTIGQTAEAIKLEAKAREEAIDEVTKEYESKIEQSATNIKANVVQKTSDGTSSGFGWNLDSSSWSIQATLDGEQKDILKADTTGLTVYGDITARTLNIENATIEGKLTSANIDVKGLTAESIKVIKKDESGNIIGTSGKKYTQDEWEDLEEARQKDEEQIVLGADSESGKVIIGGFDVTPNGFGNSDIQFTVDGLTIGSNFWVDKEGNTSIAKGDPGKDGQDGKDGEIGTFHIIAEPDQFRVSGVKSSYNSQGSFNFNFKKQTGDEDPIDLKDSGNYYYEIVENNKNSTNSDGIKNYTTYSNTSYKIDDLYNTDSITIKLYNENQSLLGTKTISVLQDGIDGTDGVTYFIVPEFSQIKVRPDTSSTTIYFGCYRQVGIYDWDTLPEYEYDLNNNYHNYYYGIYVDDDYYSTYSSSCNGSSSYSYGLENLQNFKTITIKLYDSYRGLLDTKTISIVKDGRSVLSTTKFYTLVDYEPNTPIDFEPFDWYTTPPEFDKDIHTGWNYYESIRTEYDTYLYDSYIGIPVNYSWSTPIQNSMLSVDFINSLGITAKKMEVPNLFVADSLTSTPNVKIAGFDVSATSLHSSNYENENSTNYVYLGTDKIESVGEEYKFNVTDGKVTADSLDIGPLKITGDSDKATITNNAFNTDEPLVILSTGESVTEDNKNKLVGIGGSSTNKEVYNYYKWHLVAGQSVGICTNTKTGLSSFYANRGQIGGFNINSYGLRRPEESGIQIEPYIITNTDLTYKLTNGTENYTQVDDTKDHSKSTVGMCFLEGANAYAFWAGKEGNLGNKEFRVGHDGTVYTKGGVVYNSDKELKDNIKDLIDSTAYDTFFDNLQSKTFNFKDETTTHTGFIAQDVEAALNNSGLTKTDFAGFKSWTYKDESGKELTRYGLNYSEFIALNTAQIQKLKKQVADQETRIVALEETIKNLTTK